jgi:hypothetical protein
MSNINRFPYHARVPHQKQLRRASARTGFCDAPERIRPPQELRAVLHEFLPMALPGIGRIPAWVLK